jgi:hypothetical protein
MILRHRFPRILRAREISSLAKNPAPQDHQYPGKSPKSRLLKLDSTAAKTLLCHALGVTYRCVHDLIDSQLLRRSLFVFKQKKQAFLIDFGPVIRQGTERNSAKLGVS